MYYTRILGCLSLIDDPESSEVAAYLKKILKTGNRQNPDVNGSEATTPHKSSGSVPDLLMGVDVSIIRALLNACSFLGSPLL